LPNVINPVADADGDQEPADHVPGSDGDQEPDSDVERRPDHRDRTEEEVAFGVVERLTAHHEQDDVREREGAGERRYRDGRPPRRPLGHPTTLLDCEPIDPACEGGCEERPPALRDVASLVQDVATSLASFVIERNAETAEDEHRTRRSSNA
jgi:hypothetical protein